MPHVGVGLDRAYDPALPAEALRRPHLQWTHLLLHHLRRAVAAILAVQVDGAGDMADSWRWPLLARLLPLPLHRRYRVGARHRTHGMCDVPRTGTALLACSYSTDSLRRLPCSPSCRGGRTRRCRCGCSCGLSAIQSLAPTMQCSPAERGECVPFVFSSARLLATCINGR